jgi:PKD repeat protein
VVVNAPVSFASTSAPADGWSWDFGDGTNSNEEAPVHTYALPGTYTVTLVATYGDCSDNASIEVSVEQNVGLISLEAGTLLNAWATAEHIVLVHDLDGPLLVELLDANGRVHRMSNSAAGAGTVRLPSGGLSDGLWFVRVTHAGAQRTLRVPLVR